MLIQALDQNGISYSTPGYAIGPATALCLYVDQGHTNAEAIQWAAATDRNASLSQAAKFTAIAESIYCPNNASH